MYLLTLGHSCVWVFDICMCVCRFYCFPVCCFASNTNHMHPESKNFVQLAHSYLISVISHQLINTSHHSVVTTVLARSLLRIQQHKLTGIFEQSFGICCFLLRWRIGRLVQHTNHFLMYYVQKRTSDSKDEAIQMPSCQQYFTFPSPLRVPVYIGKCTESSHTLRKLNVMTYSNLYVTTNYCMLNLVQRAQIFN